MNIMNMSGKVETSLRDFYSLTEELKALRKFKQDILKIVPNYNGTRIEAQINMDMLLETNMIRAALSEFLQSKKFKELSTEGHFTIDDLDIDDDDNMYSSYAFSNTIARVSKTASERIKREDKAGEYDNGGEEDDD